MSFFDWLLGAFFCSFVTIFGVVGGVMAASADSDRRSDQRAWNHERERRRRIADVQRWRRQDRGY